MNRLERLEALLKSGGKDSRDDACGDLGMTEDWGSGEGDLVDRLAAEVNHLNFLVSHCQGAALLDVFKPVRSCSIIYHLVNLNIHSSVPLSSVQQRDLGFSQHYCILSLDSNVPQLLRMCSLHPLQVRYMSLFQTF